ncbi:antA/AntB antirepressor family protein [Methylorubrum suomiense]
MTSFPTVSDQPIGGGAVPTVDARELHAFLDVRRDFSTWIKDRLQTYGFAQDVDFVIVHAAPQIGEWETGALASTTP